ncbi:MAG TPA: hypothetical protein VEB20_07155 [Azospirillaceae bacterium]|nr:hypothetical protein [Azospirillaceae bacterium]
MSSDHVLQPPTGAPLSGSADVAEREGEAQLAVMVPASVKRAVLRAAMEQETTIRTIVLRALKAAGVVELPELEMTDRRATVARARGQRPPGAE